MPLRAQAVTSSSGARAKCQTSGLNNALPLTAAGPLNLPTLPTEQLNSQVKKVKTSQGTVRCHCPFPEPWWAISFAVVLHGMNSSVVVLVGALPVHPRWQKGLCSVNLANTEWSAITQMRSFWLLLLQPPCGHWRLWLLTCTDQSFSPRRAANCGE